MQKVFKGFAPPWREKHWHSGECALLSCSGARSSHPPSPHLPSQPARGFHSHCRLPLPTFPPLCSLSVTSPSILTASVWSLYVSFHASLSSHNHVKHFQIHAHIGHEFFLSFYKNQIALSILCLYFFLTLQYNIKISGLSFTWLHMIPGCHETF